MLFKKSSVIWSEIKNDLELLSFYDLDKRVQERDAYSFKWEVQSMVHCLMNNIKFSIKKNKK